MEEDLRVSLWLRSGPVPDFTRRIPGLKGETPRHAGAGWGTRPVPSKFATTGNAIRLVLCDGGLFLGGVILGAASWGLGKT
jgi:hypothetical protein